MGGAERGSVLLLLRLLFKVGSQWVLCFTGELSKIEGFIVTNCGFQALKHCWYQGHFSFKIDISSLFLFFFKVIEVIYYCACVCVRINPLSSITLKKNVFISHESGCKDILLLYCRPICVCFK